MKTVICIGFMALINILSINANGQTFQNNRINRKAKRQSNAQNIANSNAAIRTNNMATYNMNKNNRQAASADGVLTKEEARSTYHTNALNRHNTAKEKYYSYE